MTRSRTAWSTALGVAATALALGACSDPGKVVQPGPAPSADIVGATIVTGQLFGPTTVSAATAVAEPGHATVCKAGVAGSFTIQVFAHQYQMQNGQIVLNSLGFPIPLFAADGVTPLLDPTPVYTNSSVTINAGECVRFHAATPFEFTIVATENASTTTLLTGITAFTIHDGLTSAQTCSATALDFCLIALGSRQVTLGELNQFHGSIATFTNAPAPPPPGTVQVCKIAGTGVTVGTNFNFAVLINGVDVSVGNPLVLPAGPLAQNTHCTPVTPFAPGTVVALQEAAVAGVTVAITSNPTTGPGAATGNNTTRTATVTVASGVNTVITFTNSIPSLGCTLTQGFWKNHPNAWPVASLTLGSVTYTKAQLLAILDTPVKGNGLISLSHQLIAAKLNIANGASATTISATISAADAMIGSRVVPPVGNGFLSPSATSSLTDALDSFNSGLTRGGPPHCGG